jgi:hypothetical protein
MSLKNSSTVSILKIHILFLQQFVFKILKLFL